MTVGHATTVWLTASFTMSLRFIPFLLLAAFLNASGSGAYTFDVSTYDAISSRRTW